MCKEVTAPMPLAVTALPEFRLRMGCRLATSQTITCPDLSPLINFVPVKSKATEVMELLAGLATSRIKAYSWPLKQKCEGSSVLAAEVSTERTLASPMLLRKGWLGLFLVPL